MDRKAPTEQHLVFAADNHADAGELLGRLEAVADSDDPVEQDLCAQAAPVHERTK